MTIAPLFFYLFSTILIASAFMVIASKNPGSFRALPDPRLRQRRRPSSCCSRPSSWRLILVVVYVGAVAVLFLFVVMMLDVDFAELRQGFLKYLPIGALVGLIVVVELGFVVGSWTIGQGAMEQDREPRAVAPEHGRARQRHLHAISRAVPSGGGSSC